MADTQKIAGTLQMSDISRAGYQAVKDVGLQRQAIMEAVKCAAAGTSTKLQAEVTVNGATFGLGKLANVDIATGAGALVLDDALQELSTIEQAAAQLVAAENKAQKQVHSVTGQG